MHHRNVNIKMRIRNFEKQIIHFQFYERVRLVLQDQATQLKNKVIFLETEMHTG